LTFTSGAFQKLTAKFQFHLNDLKFQNFGLDNGESSKKSISKLPGYNKKDTDLIFGKDF
jgi:hypothetical protein